MKNLTLLCLLAVSYLSCNKESIYKQTVPLIETDSLRAVASNSLQIGGKNISDGNAEIVAKGICWSRNPNPTVDDDTIIHGNGKSNFVSYIEQLNSKTKYYFRAYATNKVGTGYGEVKEVTTGETVTDFDGNIYNTVKIGNQVWMVENLKTKHYQNGDPIRLVFEPAIWETLKEGAYIDNKSLGMGWDFYGAYYNWYAVNDRRNICPPGWHIPSKNEWATLINSLGGNVNKKLIMENYAYDSNMSGATNESGFSAVPAGSCMSVGTSPGMSLAVTMSQIAIWSSDELDSDHGSCFHIYSTATSIFSPSIISYSKNIGCSVRCIKD